MKIFLSCLAIALVTVAVVGLFIGGGFYDMGADTHHWPATSLVLETLRDRSVKRHSESLQTPDLTDEALVLKGAGQYAAMCTACHLAPGHKTSELRPGLYPLPPDLTRVRVDPRAAFWAIKHGIKMSAMPAWGGSHDDATIWSMVAFLQTLPALNAEQYKAIVARAPPDEDMDMDMDMDMGDKATD